ncbi:MAG: ABC transporter ATP-binding protein [Lachnospiraceae bacterium]|nr:ABC transporter ATP-binding protein [Lachnospiraceae bacterium]
MGFCPDKREGVQTEGREKILELKNLAVSFDTPQGEVEAVRGVDLSVERGEIVCIVGESGCGKTVLCQSVMHLLPAYSRVKSGEIQLCGRDITNSSEKELRKLRGAVMSMVFQDPLTTLNPTIPVGKQIMEMLLKQKMNKNQAKNQALQLMELTGIPKAGEKFDLQPHFLSGGMRQRCVLAAALASEPPLLLADEVTTALDVTVETKILDLLLEIRKKTGTAIIFVTHDLGAAARIADRVAVMCAGEIVEIGKAKEVFYTPRHPYTARLLSSMAAISEGRGMPVRRGQADLHLKERDDREHGKRNYFGGMSSKAVF